MTPRSTSDHQERGASAVEYGLLVAAIAAIVVTVVFAIGNFVQAGFDKTCDGVDTAAGTSLTDTKCGK